MQKMVLFSNPLMSFILLLFKVRGRVEVGVRGRVKVRVRASVRLERERERLKFDRRLF